MIIAADPLCYAVILISTTDQRERPYGSTEHAGLDHGSTPTCVWPRLWRIEMGMEQALSPPVDSVLRPHSGLRGRDYNNPHGLAHNSGSLAMLAADWSCNAAQTARWISLSLKSRRPRSSAATRRRKVPRASTGNRSAAAAIMRS